MNKRIAIIGLGYVGLPLAIEFGKKYRVLGFDINPDRIQELNSVKDHTNEADLTELKRVMDLTVNSEELGLSFSSKIEDLNSFNVYIVTVPTPVNNFKAPDLSPLVGASAMLGGVLKYGDIVIYESTVYPGVTEDEMVPVLERRSGLAYNVDFYCGYSPERINPGDKKHKLSNIIKVTSGSTPEIADVVDGLYKSIITAGTYKASTIKVAEAAKVIENSQRDINIAFVNELSKIFNLMGIDTNEVLEAAGTKWNFLKFKPGLVGGHCIGVDPYYLAQKAKELGYHPEIILAGRRLNDSMGIYVATEVVKLMLRKNVKIFGGKVLILGFTFKEDCPDIRNTKIIDIYRELVSFDLHVDVYDPHASSVDVKIEFGIDLLVNLADGSKYSTVILAVAHQSFKSINVASLLDEPGVVYDIKGFLPRDLTDARL